MDTIIYSIDNNKIDKDKIREAAALLRQGGLVAFPTETVYGLGANALDGLAVSKIFVAKGRPSDNPLIVHIYSFEQLTALAERIPEEAKILASKFWPGPLTMIFKAKKEVPLSVTGGLDTIGVRMPDDLVALEFLRAAQVPVAAPSANISGRPSPTRGEHVVEDLKGKIDGIIISKNSRIGIESTVLDITVQPALILRPGSVSLEEIREYIDAEYYLPGKTDIPRSPGTKYRHYAPKCDLYIMKGSKNEKIDKIKSIVPIMESRKVGLLISEELLFHLDSSLSDKFILKIFGSTSYPEKIIANFYGMLRDFDLEEVDIIYMEEIQEEITGKAFQNRVEKASGGKLL